MREPDVTGAGGSAWEVCEPDDGPPDWKASLLSYWVHAPGAHPVWDWWRMGLVHLRPIEGVRPAVLHYPEAEFELLFFALDPSHPVDVDGVEFHMLEPVDLCEQFHGVTDDQARELLRGCVRAVCAGIASPDSDFREWWRGTIRNTLQHMVLGGHPEGGS